MVPTDTLTCQVTPNSVEPTSLSCSVPPLEWLNLWTTIGSVVTALATMALVIAAIWAGRIAVNTLRQMKADSAAQTRPYVYVNMSPGMFGPGNWDITIRNSGRSSARDLTLSTDAWPEAPDKMVSMLQTMFDHRRTLPPDTQIRAVWRFDKDTEMQDDTDGNSEYSSIQGMPQSSTVTVRYRGDAPSAWYEEDYLLSSETIGLTPGPHGGPNPQGNMTEKEKSFHKMLSRIAQNIGELSRNT